MNQRFFSRSMKKVFWVGLGVLFACVTSFSARGFGVGTSESPTIKARNSQKSASSRSSQSGKSSAAKGLQIVDLEGYRKLLADHRGKPLLITFWATWCEPCREEFPLVNEMAKQYASQGLVVVGVDKDDDAEMHLVYRFIDRNQPVFPSVRQKPGHEDAFNDGVDPRWRGVMPANFFYTADGQLAGFMVGAHPREDFEKMIHAILPQHP